MSSGNYNYSDTESPTAASLHVPANHAQKVAVTVVIVIFAVWCAVANTVTILAIALNRHMRTKTNVFILSLAISDMLSTLIASPLWLYRRTWGFDTWELGTIPCKLYWFTDEMTSYCTSMHIASFAVWRFALIRWPHKMANTAIRTTIIWVCVLWTIAMIFGGFIYSTFYRPMEKSEQDSTSSTWPMCSIDFDNNGIARFRRYYMFSATTFIILPMAILLVVSSLIARELVLKKAFKSELRKLKEKRAVAQPAMISTSFMIGYLPMTTHMLWTTFTEEKDIKIDYWTGVGAYLLLRCSECMNPVAYNAASSKMRQASKAIVLCVCTCGRVRRTRTPSGSST